MAYTPQTTGVIGTPQSYNTSPTAYSPAYGGIPNLPKYTTDTTQQAGTDVQSQMIQNLPNYQNMVSQATGNIGANLQGQVAPDVAYNLGQQAAEMGAGEGQSLSPAAATSFLAKYGLTSNALQTQGQQQLLAQMQATPMQQTSTGQQITDQGAAQAVYNAAPTPSAAAAAAMNAAQGGINSGKGSIASAPGATSAPTSGMGYGVPNFYAGASGGGMTPGDPNNYMTQNFSDVMGFGDMGSQQTDWTADPYGQGWNDLGV